MQLYLFRHGPAEPRNTWIGDDAERPLTNDGRQLVTEVAMAMQRSGLLPEIILTSPLVRARQSAAILADCFTMTERVLVDKRLAPGFGLDDLQKILRDYSKQTSLLLVGQEPDLSHTISKVVGRTRIALKKGGLAQIEVPDIKTPKGHLLGLLSPTFFADFPHES
jgi:phosphohistidine phosphatase